MSIASDLRTLFKMTALPIRGRTHEARLESFYGRQAADYDAFRAHLLRGRQELYEALTTPEGGVWVEMGGGTAHNLEFLGARLGALSQVYVVDLSASLLQVAQQRIRQRGWANVQLVHGDALTFEPAGEPVDVVTFSYSLTMIADWFAALEQAWRILKPGGVVAVVDFYVARKFPAAGLRKHGWVTRSFWPMWLALDNVYPSADHVPFLRHFFEQTLFAEYATRMRYFPLLKVPYYFFIGRKRLGNGSAISTGRVEMRSPRIPSKTAP